MNQVDYHLVQETTLKELKSEKSFLLNIHHQLD